MPRYTPSRWRDNLAVSMRYLFSATAWTGSPHLLFPTARSAVMVADDPALAEPLADRYATVIAEAARECGAKTVLGTSSTFSKDVLPRAAALLDAPMITDVVAIEEINGSIAYRRPINAGSMFAVVKVEGQCRVLTVRATAFEPPAADSAPCPIERFPSRRLVSS